MSRVKQGQQIAKVGYPSVDPMLHFEVYWGSESGELSDPKNSEYPFVPAEFKSKKFQRRKDLLDPTQYLNLMCKNSDL